MNLPRGGEDNSVSARGHKLFPSVLLAAACDGGHGTRGQSSSIAGAPVSPQGMLGNGMGDSGQTQTIWGATALAAGAEPRVWWTVGLGAPALVAVMAT